MKADLNTKLKRELDAFEIAAGSYELSDFFDKQVKTVTGKQIAKMAKSGR